MHTVKMIGINTTVFVGLICAGIAVLRLLDEPPQESTQKVERHAQYEAFRGPKVHVRFEGNRVVEHNCSDPKCRAAE